MKKRMTFSSLRLCMGVKRFWQKHANLFGLPLVYLGVLAMAVVYATGLSNHNWLMLLALFLIVAGIVGHVASLRHDSKY
jgi:uncharacterized membrane protein HdeD (DUF308 family)